MYAEAYARHWTYLGKAICNDWTDVYNEPFVAEKHNNAVNSIDMDMQVLYTEYPKLLDILSTDYNINSISNECLSNTVSSISNTIDAIPTPATPTQMGHTHLVITDPLKDNSMLDPSSTSATVGDGEATLDLTGQPFDLTSTAKAYVINPMRFYKKSDTNSAYPATAPVVISDIQGISSQTEILQALTGIESNGFPGSTHEGRITMGTATDTTGNTSNTQVIEPVSGQDIHNDINSILDGKPTSWYEYELVNVQKKYLSQSPEVPYGDPHGYTYAKPYTYIRWAIGKEGNNNDGETLKLAINIKLDKQVPVNQISVKLQNISGYNSQSVGLDGVYCKSVDSSKWTLIDHDSKTGVLPTSTIGTTTPTTENPVVTPTTNPVVGRPRKPDLTASNSRGSTTTTTTSTTTGGGILGGNTTTTTSSTTTSGTPTNVYGGTGITNEPGQSPYVNESTEGGTGGSGELVGSVTVMPPIAQVGDDVSDPTFASYYSNVTSDVDLSSLNGATQLDISSQAVSTDESNNETIHNYKFANSWVSELLILLSQKQSYECDIIHKYYERVWNVQTVSSTTSGGGLLGGDQHTTQYSSNQAYVFREEGEGIAANILYAGVQQASNSISQGTLGTIGRAMTTVGSAMSFLSLGGSVAPILLGVGAILSLFSSTTSTSESTNITSDQHISGVELIPGWRYAIGINDVSIYSNNYATSSDIISKTFDVPFKVKQVQVSVSQLTPRSYPSGEWFKHFISIDGGSSWIAINPKNYPPTNSTYPSTILVNPDTSSTRQIYGSKSITTDKPATTVKYKCTISRPDNIPYQTPTLLNYSIYVEGTYSL